MLLSFKFLFSSLKKRHVSNGAECYFCLFWETMLVSLDSNQPGRGEASSRVQAWISEAESGGDLCARKLGTTATRMCARESSWAATPGGYDQDAGRAAIFMAVPFSSLQSPRGKKILGEKKTLPEGPLWTQCQPETAADGEQQHQGPTVPSCPASSTPERTVKRPRVGEQPTRTKELAAGKTTWALSNSSQNNPFPRVSRSGEGEKI